MTEPRCSETVIRDATPEDWSTVLTLNHADVANLSPLSRSQLAPLTAISSSFRVAEVERRFAGFLIAIGSERDHESVNFRWFKQRYPRFVYIDRVVVARESRGLGVATKLYADLEAHAARLGAPLLACEVNVRPSNAPSMAFHRRLGFEEVGVEERDDGKKTVSMLVKQAYLVTL